MLKSMPRLLLSITLLIMIIGVGVPALALQNSPGPLEKMLAQVSDNQISRRVIWYGAMGDLEQMLGLQIKSADDFKNLDRNQQAAYLLDVSGKQVYYSQFSGLDQSAQWKQTFGIDSFSIEREITVGVSPNWYGVLQGNFSSATIIAALQAIGYKPAAVSGATVYAASKTNISQTRYNRMIVSDTVVIAAPSDALIKIAIPNTGQPLVADPAYAALVHALEGQATIPGTQLISAALFNGPFLSDTLITADPLASSMKQLLSADQLGALSKQLGLANEKPLPRYTTAAIGYRRNAQSRFWVIALTYADGNTANAAAAILADRLPRYASFRQSGRPLFQGWPIAVNVKGDGAAQVVIATMQLPAQTDVAWIDLINQRDLGFLAAASQ
ncbi:MAG: hypothetical protein ABI947_14250 [Chloroflexota bacterium]